MADISKVFGSKDPKNDAQWFTLEGTDIEMFIAPIDNPAVKQDALSQTKVSAEAIDSNLFDVQKDMLNLVAKHVLLDWKNVEMDGKVLDYSTENALDLLVSYTAINEWVQEKASSLSEEREKALETAKKKSKK